MGPVRKYEVTVNGYRTVLRLTEADAKAYPGAVPVDKAGASQVSASETSAKARTPANKARRGKDK